jgi:MFS family permease
MDTLKGFSVGITIGAIIGGYFGYNYGLKVSGEKMTRPEFRIVFASVVLAIWGTAQLMGLLFNTEVDPWLNTITGIVVGFFYGDGIVEKYKGK